MTFMRIWPVGMIDVRRSEFVYNHDARGEAVLSAADLVMIKRQRNVHIQLDLAFVLHLQTPGALVGAA